ncbi:MAG: carbohydrate porin [Chlamydiota bacterium]
MLHFCKFFTYFFLLFVAMRALASVPLEKIDDLHPEQHLLSGVSEPFLFVESCNGLTGNWGGARSDMRASGIDFHGSYAINAAANAGGRSQGATQASSLQADLTFDLEQLCSLPYCELFISGAYRFGRNLAALRIGNTFSVQQVFGGQTIRLIDLYLACKIPELLMVKIGRINTGEDFQISPLFSQFMNNSFNGNPIIPNFNFLFSVFPVSTWGAYCAFYPLPKVCWKTGIYQNNPRIFANETHGVYFRFTPSLGALVYTEASCAVDHSASYSATYKVGGAYSTGRTNRVLKPDVRGNYELYLQWEQTIAFEERTRFLSPFFTFLYFPADRNLFSYFYMLGFQGLGWVPTREKDGIHFGFSQGFFSKKLGTRQTFEGAFELNYKAQITPYFYLQPNLQYVLRPAGYRNRTNALVFGLQSECIF